jgi:hypothetical protein
VDHQTGHAKMIRRPSFDAVVWVCVFAGCAAAWCNWLSNVPIDLDPFRGLFLGILIQAILVTWFLRWRWKTFAPAKAEHNRLLCLCSVCGYDLRATPQRCPECGSVPARPVVAAPSFSCQNCGREAWAGTTQCPRCGVAMVQYLDGNAPGGFEVLQDAPAPFPPFARIARAAIGRSGRLPGAEIHAHKPCGPDHRIIESVHCQDACDLDGLRP